MYSAPSGPGVLYRTHSPRAHQDGLPGRHVDLAPLMLDSQHAGQHDRVFVEFGPLARLDPPRRRPHLRDAHGGFAEY